LGLGGLSWLGVGGPLKLAHAIERKGGRQKKKEKQLLGHDLGQRTSPDGVERESWDCERRGEDEGAIGLELGHAN